MIIRTATWPKGPAKHLEQGDIVQVLQPNGRFRDVYVADLQTNDEYFAPQGDTYRSSDAILSWMEENGIEVDYDLDDEGEHVIKLSREYDRSPLVTYPRGKNCLRESCEFCMDLEEQHGVPELVKGTRDALEGLTIR